VRHHATGTCYWTLVETVLSGQTAKLLVTATLQISIHHPWSRISFFTLSRSLLVNVDTSAVYWIRSITEVSSLQKRFPHIDGSAQLGNICTFTSVYDVCNVMVSRGTRHPILNMAEESKQRYCLSKTLFIRWIGEFTEENSGRSARSPAWRFWFPLCVEHVIQQIVFLWWRNHVRH
jgi:hypothetical protein